MSKRRWFRPVIPCMLVGFVWGLLPQVRSSPGRYDDFIEAAWGAAWGFAIGLALDVLVNPRRP